MCAENATAQCGGAGIVLGAELEALVQGAANSNPGVCPGTGTVQ